MYAIVDYVDIEGFTDAQSEMTDRGFNVRQIKTTFLIISRSYGIDAKAWYSKMTAHWLKIGRDLKLII